MALAGEIIVAGKVPGERIATQVGSSDSTASTGFSDEIVADSVTANLVEGRTYRVRWVTGINRDGGDSSNQAFAAINADGLQGAILQQRRIFFPSGSTTEPLDGTLESLYTASSTGNKTFVGTVRGSASGGTAWAEGAGSRERFLYVEYVEGP